MLETIDSKQSAQLKKILGVFADDRSTVCSRHLRNINHDARRLIEAATAPRTRGNNVSVSTLFTKRVREGRDAGDVIRGNGMSSKDVHAPRAQNFHPEFGYVCPSPQMRRRVRSGAMTAGAMLLIAVGTALALVPQLAPQSGGESALTATAPSPTERSAGLVDGVDLGQAGESTPAAMTRTAAVADRGAGSHAPAACEDPSGAFLAPQCQLGKTGKSRVTRTARVPGSRVATFRIGRADAGLKAEPENVAAAGPSAAAEAATTAFAMDEAPPLPRERPAAPVKKPVKIAQKQTPSRDVARPDTPATAPSPGFDLFGLFREPPRSAGGAWAMSWPLRPPMP
ncbi:MAG TPA: hypothetical protein VG291_15260 [Xanthobacteraceae bacterium]|nr:hypothetical protein [Xanthobacteraceae bacterium]